MPVLTLKYSKSKTAWLLGKSYSLRLSYKPTLGDLKSGIPAAVMGNNTCLIWHVCQICSKTQSNLHNVSLKSMKTKKQFGQNNAFDEFTAMEHVLKARTEKLSNF